MNKTVRLALLLALTALAGWTSTPRAAHALPVCSNLNNRACLNPNQSLACTLSGGNLGVCLCDPDTRKWDCS